jgi:hypothetical protein
MEERSRRGGLGVQFIRTLRRIPPFAALTVHYSLKYWDGTGMVRPLRGYRFLHCRCKGRRACPFGLKALRKIKSYALRSRKH